MTGPNKSRNNNNLARRFAPKPKPLTPQEAVPVLIFGPNNNWIDFSKMMCIAAGHSYGRLSDIIDQGSYYVPRMPTPDMSIIDSTLRDKDFESDLKERSKSFNRLEENKPMLYMFILSKISVESEDELKRHTNYPTFSVEKDPLELRKALEELHRTTTVSKNAEFVLQQCENDYLSCT